MGGILQQGFGSDEPHLEQFRRILRNTLSLFATFAEVLGVLCG